MRKLSDYEKEFLKQDVAEIQSLYKDILYFKSRIQIRSLENNLAMVEFNDNILGCLYKILKKEVKNLEDFYGIKAHRILSAPITETSGFARKEPSVADRFIADIKPEDLGLARR